MLQNLRERIEKTNEQRIQMAVTLIGVMKSPIADIMTKSAVAASMMDMIDKHMIPEDIELIKGLSEAIQSVNEEAKQYGVDDLMGSLNKIRAEVSEKMDRIEEGTEILKSLNLDNIDLN